MSRYSTERSVEWNTFVDGAKNGTFLFLRAYMDYHSDRFADHSLMFYTEGHKLVALLPANERDGILYSHQGLTYGGLIMSEHIRLADVGEVFKALVDYMKAHGLCELVYKPVPAIYHRLPSEEDLYWLWKSDATVVRRSVMTVVPLWEGTTVKASERKRSYRNRLLRDGMTVRYDTPLCDFWPVLEQNLLDNHGARPVHTLDEIERLKKAFPENIYCATVADASENVLAGVVLYVTEQVVKTQYISASEEGKRQHVLDFLLMQVVEHCHEKKTYRYFDFGTSMLENGVDYDSGLVAQKEGFGGRTVVCDVLSIKPHEH